MESACRVLLRPIVRCIVSINNTNIVNILLVASLPPVLLVPPLLLHKPSKLSPPSELPRPSPVARPGSFETVSFAQSTSRRSERKALEGGLSIRVGQGRGGAWRGVTGSYTWGRGPTGTSAVMSGSSSSAAVLFVGTHNLLGLSVAHFLDQVCG